MYQVDVKECTYNHLRNYLGSINDKLARWIKKKEKSNYYILVFLGWDGMHRIKCNYSIKTI
jgi:late competence protein required for DNA uptake (superfamily II DNA/RNA helicase)